MGRAAVAIETEMVLPQPFDSWSTHTHLTVSALGQETASCTEQNESRAVKSSTELLLYTHAPSIDFPHIHIQTLYIHKSVSTCTRLQLWLLHAEKRGVFTKPPVGQRHSVTVPSYLTLVSRIAAETKSIMQCGFNIWESLFLEISVKLLNWATRHKPGIRQSKLLLLHARSTRVTSTHT